MSALAAETYRAMGLNDYEFSLICKLLGREPNYVELGMFAVMWSEHCGYKYSRPVLAYFKQYKEALEGSGFENAGVVAIDETWGVTMKVESHNHPSAVEPYQGAATGVGGIIRDIFTMGARPIAALNSLRFGPIEGDSVPAEVIERNKYLFRRVVAGIGGYGNCVGVPTVGGEVGFHPKYSGNPLVNAMAVGMVKLNEITTAAAAGIGNPVIYLGSATGRDGIHGATFASDALGADNEDKRPNVQIGDPFAEKILIEATLEALQTGAIASIQDMGAAGLTCSTIEMSAKGKVGMKIDLDLVPMREADMSAYELLLSESQERMLAVAHLGREQEVIDIFHKWGTHAVVIGHVTEGNVKIYRHGELAVDVPAPLLADECPAHRTEPVEPKSYRQSLTWSPESLPALDPHESLLKLLATPNIASKRWVYRQYDSEVQTQTMFGPGSADAAVLAPRGTKRGIAFSLDGNSRWCAQDPYVGGVAAVCEAARNVACTGAKPVALTDGLNFGNPQLGHVFWQFERAVRGIADAAEAIEAPVISGNVSFYNESDLGEVPPTPLIGALGILQDVRDAIGLELKGSGTLAILDYNRDLVMHEGLGASEYLATCHGKEEGRPVLPEMHREKQLYEFLSEAAAQGWLRAAHDISDGGLAVGLAEMVISGESGAAVETDGPAFAFASRIDSRYFGELSGRVILAYLPENAEHLLLLARLKSLNMYPIGEYSTNFDGLKMDSTVWSSQHLAEIYLNAIPRAMGDARGVTQS